MRVKHVCTSLTAEFPVMDITRNRWHETVRFRTKKSHSVILEKLFSETQKEIGSADVQLALAWLVKLIRAS